MAAAKAQKASSSPPLPSPISLTHLSSSSKLTHHPFSGWGQYLHYSLKIPVINKAFAGRSARSFTRENRFEEIGNLLKKGDFVIIEFGHNDGASHPDNGRSDCPGNGTGTCRYTYK